MVERYKPFPKWNRAPKQGFPDRGGVMGSTSTLDEYFHWGGDPMKSHTITIWRPHDSHNQHWFWMILVVYESGVDITLLVIERPGCTVWEWIWSLSPHVWTWRFIDDGFAKWKSRKGPRQYVFQIIFFQSLHSLTGVRDLIPLLKIFNQCNSVTRVLGFDPLLKIFNIQHASS